MSRAAGACAARHRICAAVRPSAQLGSRGQLQRHGKGGASRHAHEGTPEPLSTRQLATFAVVALPSFFVMIVIVTILELDFLRSLGWHLVRPGDSPPWPSATALGDYGFLTVAAFVIGGSGALAVSVAVRRTLRVRYSAAAWALAALGVAMLLLAFPVDRAMAEQRPPTTWHGAVHAAGFALLLLSAVASMVLVAIQSRRDSGWRDLAIPSWVAVAVMVMIFVLAADRVIGFATVLVVLLAWMVVIALRAGQLAANRETAVASDR